MNFEIHFVTNSCSCAQEIAQIFGKHLAFGFSNVRAKTFLVTITVQLKEKKTCGKIIRKNKL